MTESYISKVTHRAPQSALATVLLASLLQFGCTALLGKENDPLGSAEVPKIGWLKADDSKCGPQEQKYLRLTPQQYQNAAQQLLGPLPDFTDKIGRQLELAKRRYQATIYAKDLTENHVSDLFTVSEEMAALASHERWDLMTACLSSEMREKCIGAQIEEAGQAAFRRPLTPEEADVYTSFVLEAKQDDGPRTIVSELISAWLLSPAFLHRAELASTPDPHELASLVSFTLADRSPDEQLMKLADDGSLSDPAVLEEQVRRLLLDPASDRGLLSFIEQWLELDGLTGLAKDPALFPQWDADLQQAMRQEVLLVAREVLLENRGQPSDLLTVDFTYVNQRLALLYGLHGQFSDDFTRVPLPEDRRGVLALSGFLARHARSTETDIVRRGLFVRTQVMCSPVGAPPPNAAAVIPESDEFKTQRERLDAIHSLGSCANCHRLMDPLGYAFESYDAIGSSRTEDNGQPIRNDGIVRSSSQGDLSFEGSAGLSEKLGSLSEVNSCLTTQLYSYVLGRQADQTDYCTLRDSEFAREKGSFLDGIVALFLSDTRRPRIVPPNL